MLYLGFSIAITIAIVEAIKKSQIFKDKILFNKIKLDNYKLISIIICLIILIILTKLSFVGLLFFEFLILVTIPSVGYDYLYNPVIKPIFNPIIDYVKNNLFKK